MRKLIAAINMTLDGYCDHTSVAPPEEDLHMHYNDLLRNADAILYGRTTYQLMESYWPDIVKHPTGVHVEEDFAQQIDDIQKIVFSRTLSDVTWKNSILKHEIVPEEIEALKQQEGSYLLAGSPSMIVTLTKLGLIDEYQLCIHPTLAGKGLPLFKGIEGRIDLKLIRSKPYGSGPVVMFYQRK